MVIYSTIIGFFVVLKKKACERSNVLFVISMYSTIGFLLLLWSAGQAMNVSAGALGLIAIKSLIIALSWIFEGIALKIYMISSLQPISAIKVIIGFFASTIIFHEANGWWRYIGVIIVFVGLILLNRYDAVIEKKKVKQESTLLNNFKIENVSANNLTKDIALESEIVKQQANSANQTSISENKNKFNNKRLIAITYFVASCVLSEISGILDRFIMDQVTTSQMQFWFMLFVSLFSWLALFCVEIKDRRIPITKADWKNIFIYISGAVLVIGDRFMFTALTDPNVLVSGVSILKQLSTVVSVVIGALIFKEPNLKRKIVYLIVILTGIIIILI